MVDSNYGKFLSSDITLDVDQVGIPTKHDIGIAVVALMVTLAKTDKDFNEEEISEISSQIEQIFRLNAEVSRSMIQMVIPLANSPEKLFQFIEAVRSNLTPQQKQLVMAMVWRVAKSDGQLDREEASFAKSLRERLGLTMEQALRAGQMADLPLAQFHSETDEALDEDNLGTVIFES